MVAIFSGLGLSLSSVEVQLGQAQTFVVEMETSGSKMGSAGPSSAMFEPSSMDKLDNGRAEPNLVNIDTQHTSEKIAIEGALPQHQGMQKVPFVAHSATSNLGESKLSENSGDYETLDTSTELLKSVN